MAIVIAYVSSAVLAIGAVWLVAGREFTVVRDPAVKTAGSWCSATRRRWCCWSASSWSASSAWP